MYFDIYYASFIFFHSNLWSCLWLLFEQVTTAQQKLTILKPEMYKLLLSLIISRKQAIKSACKTVKVLQNNAISCNFTTIPGVSVGFGNKATVDQCYKCHFVDAADLILFRFSSHEMCEILLL